jgi:ABC-type siderophore export system fused ATPase/permease subunit
MIASGKPLMITTLIVTCTLILTAIYLFLARLFKKTRLYREVYSLRQVVVSVPHELRSKRDVRKYRKLRPYIKILRRRAIVVTLVNTSLFLVVYLGSIIMTWWIGLVFNRVWAELPVGIPLLSFQERESGRFVTPIYVITVLALTGVLYVFVREARLD